MKAIRRHGENTYKMIKHSNDRVNWNEYVDKSTGEYYEQILLPCGKCIGCRLEYSRQWANRCVMESMMHPKNTCWFLTLTIDDDHLHEYITRKGFATVKTSDISKFIKALRGRWAEEHNITEGIRFFGASEYGDTTARPHYHVLVFGCPLFDLEFYKYNGQGDVLFKSSELDHVWQKGFVTVGEFSWNTAAYTARYVTKKVNGLGSDMYEKCDIEPEATRMSRRPGIGIPYLEAHPELYDLDEIVLPSIGDRPNVVSPPKAFDRRLDSIDPKKMARIKADRRLLAELRSQQAPEGYDPYEYLEIQEGYKMDQMKGFSRNKC